jgi:hypothetical protein
VHSLHEGVPQPSDGQGWCVIVLKSPIKQMFEGLEKPETRFPHYIRNRLPLCVLAVFGFGEDLVT